MPRRLVLTLAVLAAIGWAPCAAAAAAGSTPSACKEATPGAAASDAKGLNELTTPASEPTFTVSLGAYSAKDDQIGLGPKTAKRFAYPGDVGADVIDRPADDKEHFDGTVAVAAAVNASRTRVEVTACITGASNLEAGRYEGNVLVSGPHFADYVVPIVITKKWPWWIAVGVLLAAAAAFFAVAIMTSSLVYQNASRSRQTVGTIGGIAVALVALLPVYFSSYVNNPTWGSNPQVDVSTLITAGLTAATAGLAAAHRALGGQQQLITTKN